MGTKGAIWFAPFFLTPGALAIMADLRAAIVFEDIAPIEVEVKIDGKEYRLREATVDSAAKYRNASIRAARMVDGKVVGLDGVSEAELALVMGCLFSANDKGQYIVPVARFLLESWPDRVLRELFKRAKEISGLEEKTPAQLRKEIESMQAQLAQLEEGGVGKN